MKPGQTAGIGVRETKETFVYSIYSCKKLFKLLATYGRNVFLVSMLSLF